MKADETEIRPNRIRELHHTNYTSAIRQDGRVGSMGYSWSGGVRQVEATLISRDRSTSRLLCYRLPEFPRKCDGQGKKSPEQDDMLTDVLVVVS